jgi:hypothetical protein
LWTKLEGYVGNQKDSVNRGTAQSFRTLPCGDPESMNTDFAIFGGTGVMGSGFEPPDRQMPIRGLAPE